MDTFFLILVLISIFLSFYKLSLGLSIYLLYYFLVPVFSENIIGISYNTLGIVFLAVFIMHYKLIRNRKINFTPFKPFIFLYIIYLILIPFQNRTPLGFQIESFVKDILMNFLIPIIIWNVINDNPKNIKYFIGALFGIIFISGIYGLILTQTNGINPYLMNLFALGGEDFSLDYAMGIGSGRLFGRISSVFKHPMTFGLILNLSFFLLIYYIREKKHLKITYILFLLVTLNCLFCGVRTVLASIIIAYCYYLYKVGVGKNMKYLLFFVAVFGFILILFPAFGDYFSSFLGSSGKVEGSSITMRLEQLEGCFQEISNSFLVGNGYNWVGYYFLNNNADHPIILAFESLIFIVICNGGVIGSISYIVFFWMLLKSNKKLIIQKGASLLINVLCISYLIYSCITGEYGYLRYFLVFYIIILGLLKRDDNFKMINKA